MADVCSLCLDTRDEQHDARKADKRPSPQLDDGYLPHDIFLSHSGVQKGFVKDLYQELEQNGFSTFLDIKHHSLPPGEHFPSRIFRAAKSCSVALVVLSEEFVCSKWPMVELCTFVDAMTDNSDRFMRLLPLFFKLSPADLKCTKNLERWREVWRVHAEQDGKHRIDVSKWEEAVQKLCSQNGIRFEQASEGEQNYIGKILSAVSAIVRRASTFDTTFIVGKDRLCQVILDKLESMDCHQSSRVTISSRESASASTSSRSTVTQSSTVPCVLGLYGLPGSGKSALCRCLVEHFQPMFGSNNALYLEFSSTASHAEVVNKLMELRHLTNFRERVGLDRASEIEHVESLLKSCRLYSRKVFLVLDNISDKTWEAVHRILYLGFGRGSKIILVAHTLEILRKTLDALEHGLQWVCDSMAVPSIDDTEASEILLRSARGNYGAAFDKQTLLNSLTYKQMGTVKRIVHMCHFRGDREGGHVWLPLVMKAVGARLLKYNENDFARWESDVESFWMSVKTYAQSAVIEELLGDNFKALLNERLQVLFLDVSLFILHLENEMDRVVDTLSMMHRRSESEIRMLIQDLVRCGFLIVFKGGIIRVHDVYLQFARSIHDGPSKYITTPISWCWKEYQIPEAESGRSFLLKEDHTVEHKGKLRTLVLEVVGESCERVDLQGFSGLTAVILRNCKSVAVLGLAGLGSLTILEVRNCASFGRVECSDRDDRSLLNITRLRHSKALAEVDEEQRGQVSYFLQPMVNAVNRVLMASLRQPKSLGVGFDLLSRMRSLQDVHLENTGISRLVCVGGMWPQLRHLTVIEQHLESFKLGSLPKLERLLFRDVGQLERFALGFLVNEPRCLRPHRSSEMWRHKEGNVRYLLEGQDLLLGCPQLKRVSMQSSFLEQGRLGTMPAGMVSLELHYLYTATKLPDLSSSARTLQFLDVHCCEMLERVNFDTGFKSLTTLGLSLCHNLVEVNGHGSLPSLRVLKVCKCGKLQNMKGFENSEELEELSLVGLSELRETSFFSSPRKLRLRGCPKLMGKLTGHLCNMEKLVQCDVSIDGECCFNLSSCKSLEFLTMFVDKGSLVAGLVLKLEGLHKLQQRKTVSVLLESSEEADYERCKDDAMCGLSSVVRLGGKGSISIDLSHFIVSDRSNPFRSDYVKLEIHPGGCVYGLMLCDCVLRNVEGMGQYLATLETCMFCQLPNLRSLRGVESLTQLWSLYVKDCPVLEEVPSLHALVRMEILLMVDCPKVIAVEGCDDMTLLRSADFTGCKSMERLPFSKLDKLMKLRALDFGRCKFASDVERMAAWVKDESAPIPLRMEALRAALAQYYQDAPHPYEEEKKERVANLLWWSMVRWMPLNNNGCLDFSWLEHAWSNDRYVASPSLQVVREFCHRLMERELHLHAQSHVHISSIVHFLNDPHVFEFATNKGLSYALIHPSAGFTR